MTYGPLSHVQYGDVIRLARSFNGPDFDNPEYLRGQIELIADLFGLPLDEWRDRIEHDIREGEKYDRGDPRWTYPGPSDDEDYPGTYIGGGMDPRFD